MTDDSLPTDPVLFDPRGNPEAKADLIRREYEWLRRAKGAPVEGAVGRLFSRERESEELLNDRLSNEQWGQQWYRHE